MYPERLPGIANLLIAWYLTRLEAVFPPYIILFLIIFYHKIKKCQIKGVIKMWIIAIAAIVVALIVLALIAIATYKDNLD